MVVYLLSDAATGRSPARCTRPSATRSPCGASPPSCARCTTTAAGRPSRSPSGSPTHDRHRAAAACSTGRGDAPRPPPPARSRTPDARRACELPADDDRSGQVVRDWLADARRRRVRRAARPRRPRRRGRRLRRPRRAGSSSSARPAGSASAGRSSTAAAARRVEPAGHLGRGVRPGPGARAGQPHGREPARARPSSRTAPRSSRRGSCPASCAATSGGARATASPTPAPTSPTSRPRARARRRRVGDQRPEGVDVAGPRERTGASSSRAPSRRPSGTRGLSFLLVPMDQPGVEVRPIVQITGGGEFNEVFFDGARTAADLVVGEPGDGWRVAMGLLGFERGISTLAQQVGFERELDHGHRPRPPRGLDRRPGRAPAAGRRPGRAAA